VGGQPQADKGEGVKMRPFLRTSFMNDPIGNILPTIIVAFSQLSAYSMGYVYNTISQVKNNNKNEIISE